MDKIATRYISDGDELYGVIDMPRLLAVPKTALTEVYVYTKYNYDFECAIRGMLKAGVLEQVEGDKYTYPFDEIAATLEDIRKSGVFSGMEIVAMDARVADYWAERPSKPLEDGADRSQ